MRFIALCLLIVGLLVGCKKNEENPAPPKSTSKEITSSPTITGLSSATASYDASTFTYTLNVPAGTDVKALKLTLPISTSATIAPDPAVARDYTSPVIYTVTAADGSTQKYTVRVTVQTLPKSSDKQITGFSFASISPVVSASIDQTTRKITATIPASADLTSLAATITLSAKSTVSPASGVAQNFTNPVSYTVTAEDGSNQSYEVKIEKAAIVSNNIPCLLTRIEDATDAKEYIIFEYTSDGRLSKMNATKKFGYPISFEYNQNGDVTKWSSPFYYADLIYTNGKLSSFKRYINGVLQPVPNRTDGEFLGGYLTVNSNNEVTQLGGDRFEYTNGNLSRLDLYDTNNKKVNGSRFEYDTKKHFLSNNKSKGIFGALFYSSWDGIDYGSLVGIIPTFFNNPVKKIFDDGHEIRFNYTYNNNGLPVELTLTSTVPGINMKLKYTYSNCQ